MALTLLGSFALGVNLSIAFHEFGHAVGLWLGGERVTLFVLRPFGASMVLYDFDTVANRSAFLLYAWGGFAVGTVFSLAILGSSRLSRPGSLWWLIAFMTGTMGLIHNGQYLVLGSLKPFGDTSALVYGLGYSRPFLFILGLPLIVGFLYLFPRFLGAIGLTRRDPFWRWLIVAEGGLLTYPLLMMAYSASRTGVDPFDVLGFIGCLAVLCSLATAVAYYRATRLTSVPLSDETVGPRWSRAAALLGLSTLVLVGELFLF